MLRQLIFVEQFVGAILLLLAKDDNLVPRQTREIECSVTLAVFLKSDLKVKDRIVKQVQLGSEYLCEGTE
jgi:hypothetical protein